MSPPAARPSTPDQVGPPPWQPQRAYPPAGSGAQAYPPPTWAAPGAAPGEAIADPTSRTSSGTSALIALVLGALLALGYAAWAFSARRGIFADLADGTFVSTDDARTSDTVDTVLLLVAAGVVLVALAWWATRLMRRQADGGPLAISGLAMAVLGLVTVGVGLLLASGAADGADQAEQADRALLATLVVAGGFLIVSVGLLLGTRVIQGRSPEQGYTQNAPFDYPRI